MMIPNSTAPALTKGTPTASPAPEKAVSDKVSVQTDDSFSQVETQTLRDALRSGPPVRADRVAHAKRLLADPNYPSADVLKQIAVTIVANAAKAENAE